MPTTTQNEMLLPIKTIFLPFGWVGINILPYHLIIVFSPYDMVMIGTLKNLISQIFTAKSFECRYKMWNFSIGGRSIRCRRFLIDKKNHMDVIRHNHVFININIRDLIPGKNTLFNLPANNCQARLRGVQGAAPYNVREDISAVLGANRYEIRTCAAIVKLRKTGWFSL